MAQLKMYWMAGTEVTDITLPKGYSVTNYKDDNDKMPWVECCKNGLVADDADEEVFDSRIKYHDDIDMSRDVFFLDFADEHIGTVTAIHHQDGNWGEMHMVGIRTDFRGKGLGKHLNLIAIKKLRDDGVNFIELTTDEWRKSAVKSYLTAGFLPVEYDEGMCERWERILTEYGIDSVDMVYENGKFCRTIYKRG